MIRLAVILLAAVLAGCSTSFETPRNLSDMALEGYAAERRPMSSSAESAALGLAHGRNAGRCEDMDIALAGQPIDAGLGAAFDEPVLLSPGDLLRLEIVRGEGFAGDYVVSPDGYVRIPHIGDIPAAGTTPSDLENTVSRLLVSGGY
ncbi:MAG: polysaccharide biosynthesis/export family protein, partial [Pseudomonadota bacterium]